MRSVDLDSLWPPHCFGVSLRHLHLSLNTFQQYYTSSQHCPCPFLNSPLTQPCFLVFTTMLAEFISPVWLVLLLASAWLSNFVLDSGCKATSSFFILCHTPVSAILLFRIMALNYYRFFGHPSPFSFES